MKGTEVFPSSFESIMSTDKNLEIVRSIIERLLTEDVFLVDMKVKPINNFKIFLDADSGLGIEKCIKINRALYKQMEEMGLYPEGDFSLEVSSPGLTEPLKMLRQYHKNVGRAVAVTNLEDETKEGELIAVTENEVTLKITEGKGKKEVIRDEVIPFDQIKSTVVQIKF